MTTTELTPNQICEAFPQSESHVTDRTVALCIQYLMDDPRNVRYLEMERMHPAFIYMLKAIERVRSASGFTPHALCDFFEFHAHTMTTRSRIFLPFLFAVDRESFDVLYYGTDYVSPGVVRNHMRCVRNNGAYCSVWDGRVWYVPDNYNDVERVLRQLSLVNGGDGT